MTKERVEPWPTKAEIVGIVRDGLSFGPGRYDGMTVRQLASNAYGTSPMLTSLTASQIRRAIGWLYGQGYLEIVEIRDGEPAWSATDGAGLSG